MDNNNIRNRKGGVTTGAANSPDPISAVQPQPQSDKDNYDGSKSKKNAVKPNSKQLQAEVLNERMNDWIDDLIDGWFRYDTKHVWIMVALTLLSFTTRFWHIGKADFVVWDEAHFGKFGSYYIKRQFYFDVHPPLGKILVGMAGVLAGYTGNFEFESGAKYPETLNYTVMRVILASFGALMVPLAYLTAVEFRLSTKAAIFTALCVLCDNAYLAISRYILLDSMLLYFTVQTVYCLSVFHNCRARPFRADWWFWLCATGVSIGTVSSIKWVGFFVTALVGIYTVEDLWRLLGDLSMPKVKFVAHFSARVLGLILIPVAVYMFSFYLHFAILNTSGPGDAQMSSLFQSQLQGNEFHKNPVDVAYYSKVTLKNNGYAGGLLHSHVQTYPYGSKQQQVTCYHHKDTNNEWIIKFPRDGVYPDEEPATPRLLRDGDLIRLFHDQTGRNLHSHHHAAPVTKADLEVSGYGNETIGDMNDYWLVEIVDDVAVSGGDDSSNHVRSLTTRFRLKHKTFNCYLRSHDIHLPEWGFKQAEVTCDKRLRQDDNNLWNIEQHWNDKMPEGTKTSYKTSFWKDFIHLNVAMAASNNALTPDPEKEPDQLTSKPLQWPFASVGLRMCGWGDQQHKVYLLGNPVVWWTGAVALGSLLAIWAVYQLRLHRGIQDWSREKWQQWEYLGKLAVFGWALHFFPFMIMARVTYLHHYFPALYFAIIAAAVALEHLGVFMPRKLRTLMFLVACGAVVGTFLHFAPLSLGFDGPASAYADRKWLSSWTMSD